MVTYYVMTPHVDPGEAAPGSTDVEREDDGTPYRVTAQGRLNPDTSFHDEHVIAVEFIVMDGEAQLETVAAKHHDALDRYHFQALYAAAEAAQQVDGVDRVEDPMKWVAENLIDGNEQVAAW